MSDETKVTRIEKDVTDTAGVITATIGILALAKTLLNPGITETSLPLMQGTFLSLTTIAFGSILTTHGATRALRQLRKTLENR